MNTNRNFQRWHIFLAVLPLVLAILACGTTSDSDVNVDAAATAVQQTMQAAPQTEGQESTGGLQPISPENLTATSVAYANQQPPTPGTADQPTATTETQTESQNLAQQPDTSSDNTQPTAAQQAPTNPSSQPTPTSAPPQPAQQGPAQPSSSTSAYVELYDIYSSNQGVDLDNSGGPDEMAYMEYKESDPNPGHAIGQRGARGTVWVDMGTSAPTYETCSTLPIWQTSLFISLGHYYCYQTDQQNYGYLRVDRLEQVGTGGSELSPWVLGISFTTWLP